MLVGCVLRVGRERLGAQ